ncbi:MAG: R3H domain-containing nucleic acid-binding protein [bacterium]
MSSVKKTAATISSAVKEYLDETKASLESVSLNLICEKIYTDKKEYTIECSVRPISTNAFKPTIISDSDITYAVEIVTKLLTLMRFIGFKIAIIKQKDAVILSVETSGKDGLLIGKNGQNIVALQYLLSSILDKNLRRHTQIIIDVDSYIDKRASYLKSLVKTMVEKTLILESETITELLPSYERKLIHEECKDLDNIKTFSLGRGSYKKLVITSLL